MADTLNEVVGLGKIRGKSEDCGKWETTYSPLGPRGVVHVRMGFLFLISALT